MKLGHLVHLVHLVSSLTRIQTQASPFRVLITAVLTSSSDEKQRAVNRQGPVTEHGDVRTDEEIINSRIRFDGHRVQPSNEKYVRLVRERIARQEQALGASTLEKHDKGLWNLARTEVWDWKHLTYTIDLSLGSPPQPFLLLLSISDSDLTVAGTKCPSHACADKRKYNASRSSTSSSSTPPEKFEAGYFRLFAENELYVDTLTIAGLTVPAQSFGAAIDIFDRELDYVGTAYDGVLGLSFSTEGSELALQSPFVQMMERQLLERNLFSLKLPSGPEDDGFLLFGEIDEEAYEGAFITMPVVPVPRRLDIPGGRWAVNATRISVSGGELGLYGYVAILETQLPFIGLPDKIAWLLEEYLGFEDGKGWDDLKSVVG